VNQKLRRAIKENVEAFAIAIILALIVRTFLLGNFKIPTGSMRPTLVEGDRIFANKLLYRFREPARGDVVIFKFPQDTKRDFIKRLIAKPGDTVRITQRGEILVNGEVLEGPGISNNFYYNRGVFGESGEDIVVPEGNFYMLGDNSGSSRDSRYWGFVPEEYIVGRAICIYWPIRRIRRVE